jgi:hypothetical protein
MHGLSSLPEWEGFYVITGSSGAALTGLMFVVIALAADLKQANPEGLSSFGTPIVAHFGTVLLIASVLTVPGHTLLSLSLCTAGCAAAGLTFAVLATVRMRRPQTYKPVMEDWIWHVVFPFVSYAFLLVMSALIPSRTAMALYGIAAVVVALLFIGIHNAWDSAMYIAVERVRTSTNDKTP